MDIKMGEYNFTNCEDVLVKINNNNHSLYSNGVRFEKKHKVGGINVTLHLANFTKKANFQNVTVNCSKTYLTNNLWNTTWNETYGPLGKFYTYDFPWNHTAAYW